MSEHTCAQKGVSFYQLDLHCPEFERATNRIPLRCAVVSLDSTHTLFAVRQRAKHPADEVVRVRREGADNFHVACTCPAGQLGVICWHVAEAWRQAALLNGWPERNRLRWQRLFERALEQGRYQDARRWQAYLRNDVAPSKTGASFEACAMRAAA